MVPSWRRCSGDYHVDPRTAFMPLSDLPAAERHIVVAD
jgi:hypothetical protein